MKHIRHILPHLLAPAILCLLASSAFAQEAAQAAKDKTFAEIWHEGGWVMYPLALSSILMMSFTAEGFYKLRSAFLCPPILVAKSKELVANGSYQELWELCNANPCYFSSVLKGGLERMGRGKEIMDHIMQEIAIKEATLLKTRNTYLSVIGVVTPMIGLTGTVVGMIKAFSVLGQSGIADPGALSAKISEVLTATAGGLIVAIPAFIFFYILKNRSQEVLIHADSTVNRLVEEIPVEELGGIRIGESMVIPSAPTAPAAPTDTQSINAMLEPSKADATANPTQLADSEVADATLEQDSPKDTDQEYAASQEVSPESDDSGIPPQEIEIQTVAENEQGTQGQEEENRPA